MRYLDSGFSARARNVHHAGVRRGCSAVNVLLPWVYRACDACSDSVATGCCNWLVLAAECKLLNRTYWCCVLYDWWKLNCDQLTSLPIDSRQLIECAALHAYFISRAYYVRGEGGKLPPLGARGRNSPNRPCTDFFWLEIWSFHVANWLWPYYVEHAMFCCILKLQFWNSKFVFFQSVLSETNAWNAPKTVWRPGSARTRWGSLSAPPDLLVTIWAVSYTHLTLPTIYSV